MSKALTTVTMLVSLHLKSLFCEWSKMKPTKGRMYVKTLNPRSNSFFAAATVFKGQKQPYILEKDKKRDKNCEEVEAEDGSVEHDVLGPELQVLEEALRPEPRRVLREQLVHRLRETALLWTSVDLEQLAVDCVVEEELAEVGALAVVVVRANEDGLQRLRSGCSEVQLEEAHFVGNDFVVQRVADRQRVVHVVPAFCEANLLRSFDSSTRFRLNSSFTSEKAEK